MRCAVPFPGIKAITHCPGVVDHDRHVIGFSHWAAQGKTHSMDVLAAGRWWPLPAQQDKAAGDAFQWIQAALLCCRAEAAISCVLQRPLQQRCARHRLGVERLAAKAGAAEQLAVFHTKV